MINSYLQSIRQQLKLQSRSPNVGPGGHPDPIIRRFYEASNNIFLRKIFQDYRRLLSLVHQNRPDMNETHLVNLWFRAIQYRFRSRNKSEYLEYSVKNWEEYFASQGLVDLPTVQNLLLTRNTATHIPVRYRSFHTALKLISKSNPKLKLRIGDVGCSFGLGLKSCLANGFLSSPEFVDDTPSQQILSSFDGHINSCSRAIGIDINIPSLRWVKACNYPSRYEQDGLVLDHAQQKLSHSRYKVLLKEADILDRKTIDTLIGNGPPLTAIYSSMAMYELPFRAQQLARRHIAKSLCDGGVFIEFTFVNPKNWFKGIRTVVRVKHHGQLSSPLIWHIWHDSRCTSVKAGKDFHQVNQILESLGQQN